MCAVAVVLLSLLFRKKSEKAKRILLWIFAAIILAFGIVRRVVGFIKSPNPDFTTIMYILLPRPGCAIACWAVVIAVVFNKKSLYNFASILGILCGIIFFAYPGAGFNIQRQLERDNLFDCIVCLFNLANLCFEDQC